MIRMVFTVAASLMLAACGTQNVENTKSLANSNSQTKSSNPADQAQSKFEAKWESLKQHKAAPDWFADAKLGIYFHWGIYSVPAWGTEWYPRWMYTPERTKEDGWGHDIYEYHVATYGEQTHYHDFIPMWKAPNFDAGEWASMFEGMGAKFIGAIAEHHDGFSLWDSEVNPWNSVDMGPKIDVVKAIADEAKKRDMKFMATFHHGFNHIFYPQKEGRFTRVSSRHIIPHEKPLVPQDEKYRLLYGNMDYDEANDYWLAKLDEVIDEFCPDYIWMDFGQRYIKEEHRKRFLANYFNRAQKLGREVVVNTKGEFFPEELAVVNVERATMPDIREDVWITDFILGSNWCYNRAKRTAINTNTAIKILSDVVSKNGVMLLSAGPMADGTIPAEQVEAMRRIGEWTSRYGEAIYSTRPFHEFGQGTTKLRGSSDDNWNQYGMLKYGFDKLNAADIRYTSKGNVVYAIQLGWAENGIEHTLKALKGMDIAQIEVLGVDQAIEWQMSNEGLAVKQPKQKPREADAALVYKISLK